MPGRFTSVRTSLRGSRCSQLIGPVHREVDTDNVDGQGRDEYYMLHHELWLQINPHNAGHLCIGCVENRLGRRLIRADFTDTPVNTNPRMASAVDVATRASGLGRDHTSSRSSGGRGGGGAPGTWCVAHPIQSRMCRTAALSLVRNSSRSRSTACSRVSRSRTFLDVRACHPAKREKTAHWPSPPRTGTALDSVCPWATASRRSATLIRRPKKLRRWPNRFVTGSSPKVWFLAISRTACSTGREAHPGQTGRQLSMRPIEPMADGLPCGPMGYTSR